MTLSVSLLACGAKNENAAPTKEVIPDVTAEPQSIADNAMEVAADSSDSSLKDAEKAVKFDSDLGYTTKYFASNCKVESADGYDRFVSIMDDQNNYISISINTDYRAEDLVEGLVLQSGTDEVISGTSTFGQTGLDSYYVVYNSAPDYNMQFTLVPVENGVMMIEIGSHIYDDEDDRAYRVSANFTDIIDNITLK